MGCDGRERGLGSLRAPGRWSWKRNGCSEHLLSFNHREREKNPEMRVQGVKRELAEPRLWSRAGHGSERCNLVLGKETQPWEVPGISVELRTSRFERRSRTGVCWEALPAREGDPTLSWGLGWDGDPLQGRRDPCPTDRGISQGFISLLLEEWSLSLFTAIC